MFLRHNIQVYKQCNLVTVYTDKGNTKYCKNDFTIKLTRKYLEDKAELIVNMFHYEVDYDGMHVVLNKFSD